MPNSYRVYRLDRASHVVEVEWISAESDDEAVAAARAMPGSGKREIWRGERLIAAVEVTAARRRSGAYWL
jgi:hypothetical protein